MQTVKAYPIIVPYALLIDQRLATCIVNYNESGTRIRSYAEVLESPEASCEDLDDLYETAAEVLESDKANMAFHNFTGRVTPAFDGTRQGFDYDDDVICYLVPKRKSGLFDPPAYRNYRDLVREFRDTLRKYIPIDMKLKPNVVRISGVRYDY